MKVLRFDSYSPVACVLSALALVCAIHSAHGATDLTVERVAVVPQTPRVGETATIQVAVRNVGDTLAVISVCPAQIFVNNIPLSFACIHIVSELPPGEAIIQEVPWVPNAACQTRITARIRYPADTNPLNDQKTIYVAVGPPAPVTDIAIVGVQISADPGYPIHVDNSTGVLPPSSGYVAVVGQSALVQVTIENQGTQRVVLTDPMNDVAVTINGANLPPVSPYAMDLSPGARAYVSFRWLPTEVGTATLVARVKSLDDGSYLPPETEVKDNTFTTTITVVEPVHDLAVPSILVTSKYPLPILDTNGSCSGATSPHESILPPPPVAGQPAWIIVYVENQGNVWEKMIAIEVSVNGESIMADQPRLRCMATDPDNGAPSRCLIPPVYGIPPGTVQAYYFQWTPPDFGTYKVEATVKPVEGETDVDDNTCTVEVNVSRACVHDMSVDALIIREAQHFPGSALNVSLAVSNQGTETETNVRVQFTINNRPFGSLSLGSFRAGESRTIPLSARIPGKAKPGTYTLRATIPPVAGELVVDNNSKETSFQIVEPTSITSPTTRLRRR